jgi:hypothetical protein
MRRIRPGTKAARVASFDDGIRSTAEVAVLAGVPAPYVRVVRQRAATGRSKSDMNYYARIHTEGDIELARRRAREAYHEARAAGGGREEVRDAYRYELERVLRATARDKRKARHESQSIAQADQAPA